MGCGSRQPNFLSLHDFLNQAQGISSSDFPANPVWWEHKEKSRLCSHLQLAGRKQTSFAGTRSRRRRPSIITSSRVLFLKRSRALHLQRRRHRPPPRHDATRSANQVIERKLRILRKLIPRCSSDSSNSSSVGLDYLFTETADYILALQHRVKLMQIMVDVLSGSN